MKQTQNEMQYKYPLLRSSDNETMLNTSLTTENATRSEPLLVHAGRQLMPATFAPQADIATTRQASTGKLERDSQLRQQAATNTTRSNRTND